jgi:CheY-like chemotaxis protein
VTANDGFEAVKAFEECGGCFDVILMDVMMPQCDGLKALGMIRQKKNGSEVPVIALTAGVGEILEKVQQEFNWTLSKPFSLVALVNALNKVGIQTYA